MTGQRDANTVITGLSNLQVESAIKAHVDEAFMKAATFDATVIVLREFFAKYGWHFELSAESDINTGKWCAYRSDMKTYQIFHSFSEMVNWLLREVSKPRVYPKNIDLLDHT